MTQLVSDSLAMAVFVLVFGWLKALHLACINHALRGAAQRSIWGADKSEDAR